MDRAKALYFEGNQRMQAGDLRAAEACFREAIALVPDFAEAIANLGFVLESGGAVEEAEACYVRALALNAPYPQLHLNHGALLFRQKRLDEAERAYRQAIDLWPEFSAAWSNLGVLLACRQREDEAEACYRKALALDPSYAKARFNLSYLALRQGRFEEGWRYLEARATEATNMRLPCPRWEGQPLAGKALVVRSEGGYGDTIQLCRYATVLKEQGARHVTWMCYPGLEALFATADGIDEAIGLEADLSARMADFWAPAWSLPFYCGTRIDTIPARVPYLHAPPERTAQWRAALPPDGVRVGLVWKGNAAFENDGERSIASLSLLAPLWSVPGVRFISLQKGAGESEAACPPDGLPVLDLGSRMEDFADAAAIVSQIDLVICVDTAVAHLSGALGKACWVLLPDYMTDWRWMTRRPDSPWYPNALRLFRQPPGGGWETVVAAVAYALQQWAADNGERDGDTCFYVPTRTQ
ncbi:MAG: tetratricopeptide repeat protein [Betaproteobacteria bacterium]|nr:tetratricopeptide repeat protein [Betaproteobacteria bacterium]